MVRLPSIARTLKSPVPRYQQETHRTHQLTPLPGMLVPSGTSQKAHSSIPIGGAIAGHRLIVEELRWADQMWSCTATGASIQRHMHAAALSSASDVRRTYDSFHSQQDTDGRHRARTGGLVSLLLVAYSPACHHMTSGPYM